MIRQTADGFLWIGTGTGLYRFDGVRFDRFEPPSGSMLRPDALTLLPSPDGGLWVTHSYGGASFVRGGEVKTYDEASGLPGGVALRMFADAEGGIWANATTSLLHFNGSRWTSLPGDWNLMADFAWGVCIDAQGATWLSASGKLYRMRRGEKNFEHLAISAKPTAVQVTKNGDLWIASDSSLLRINGAEILQMIRLPAQVDRWSELVADNNDGLWFRTLADGVYRVQINGRQDSQASVQHFNESSGLTSNHPRSIARDRQGNVWVATDGGMDQFREGAFGSVALPAGVAGLSLTPRKEGGIWAGAYRGNLLMQIQNGELIARGSIDGIYCAYTDPQGDSWIGTVVRPHIEHLAGGKSETIPVPGNGVGSITMDASGKLWALLSGLGLFRYDRGHWTGLASMGAPEHGSLSSYTDSHARIWFGFIHNRVASLEGDHVTMFSSKEGVQVGDVAKIAGASDRVWIGGERGLDMFDGHSFVPVTPSEGPSFSRISAIVVTAAAGLWLGEDRGVIQIAPSELHALKLDPHHRVRFRVFDSLDGIPMTLQPPFPGPSAAVGGDGLIYFATGNGVVWLDPNRIPEDTDRPRAVVSRLITDGAKHVASAVDHLSLPSGTTSLQIAYTAPGLTIPERVRFRYRLEGQDDTWRDAGTRREAFYTNLGPGLYKFHVMASNSDGLWSKEGPPMSFSIVPAFHQTWWFRSCYFFFASALLWVFYRYRLARATAVVRQRLGARVEERERIARDLHDTLLQSVQGLALRLQVVDDLLPPGEAKEQLDQSLDRMDQAIAEGRRAVQGLRSSLSGATLTRALQEAANEFAGGSTTFRLLIEGPERALRPLLADDVNRIAQEVLRNAFRHATARAIEVEITFGEVVFRLRIRDDGAGIPTDILTSGRDGHYGLSGIRERARQAGGKLAIWSAIGAGTEIELNIPASIAYAPSKSHVFLRRFRKNEDKL